MRYVKYAFVLFLTTLLGYTIWSEFFKPGCNKPHFAKKMTVSTVQSGEFFQWIPQAGQYDSSKKIAVVPIDEIYLDKVVTGLKGTTIFKNIEYSLQVTSVDSTVVDGRFKAEVKFHDGLTNKLLHNQSIRVRILFGEATIATLLPVGGFYKDTGGEWILVLLNGRLVEKRSIKLGKKNTGHFEVLEGLKEGEQVITSSYENFMDDEEIDLESAQEAIDKKLAMKGL